MSGIDVGGNAFQRVVPVSVAPQTITVTAPAPQDLRPGKTTSLMFQVTNFGAAGSFNFSVTDDKRFVTGVTPTTFALGTGESVNVTVKVAPPLGTPIGSSDTLSATVQNTSTPSLRNNADLTLFVTGATQTSGRPNFLAGIVGQTQVSPGVYDVDVRFTNTGPGTAKSFSISKLIFRTLSGSGAVTYSSTLAPALPLETPNVDVGSFFTVRLMVNVPATVKRFSVTESGSVLDIDGGMYAFSQAQAILP